MKYARSVALVLLGFGIWLVGSIMAPAIAPEMIMLTLVILGAYNLWRSRDELRESLDTLRYTIWPKPEHPRLKALREERRRRG
jgi:hypothetical protein